MRPVYVLGVGAHPWGKFPNVSQVSLALHALRAAAADAGVPLTRLEGLVAASSRFEGGLGWGLHANEILQASAECGAAALNVGGGCAAGGIAVHSAAMMIASGQCEVAAAIGAEKMPKGFIPRAPGAKDDPSDPDLIRWKAMGATNPAYWALEARLRMHEFGTTEATYAEVPVLMRRHAAANPRARYRTACTADEVLASPLVSDPLRLLEICAVSDGAAAVILGSEAEARKRGGVLVQVAGSAIATGQFGDPATRIPTVSTLPRDGVPHTSEVVTAARRAMERAGVGPKDVSLLELADNSAWQVLAWPEMLGFASPGESDQLLLRGEFGLGGRVPINQIGRAHV